MAYQGVLGTMAYQSLSNFYTKNEVDAIIAGRAIKEPVRFVVTSGLPSYTYSGGVITMSANGALPSIDGVTGVNGNRILVTGETSGNAPYNGIYTITDVGSAGTPVILTRATDYNTDAEVSSGDIVAVQEGTENQNTVWMLTTNESITLDTTGLTFTSIINAPVTAGNGIGVSGQQISFGPAGPVKTANYTVVAGDIGGTLSYNHSSPVTVTLPNSGISAGFYVHVKDKSNNCSTNNITVDGNGANIDGSSTFVMNVNRSEYGFEYDGAIWNVI